MKRTWIKFLIIVGVIIIALMANVLIKFTDIRSMTVTISHPTYDNILSEKQIEAELMQHYGDFLKKRRREIDTKDIKQWLEKKDFVAQADVSVSLMGDVRIDIREARALVRVFNKKGKDYYIDTEMNIISTSQPKYANAIVAYGDIKDMPHGRIDTMQNKDAYDVYKLCMLIISDSILQYQIDGVVKKDTSFLLLPKIGSYDIILGGRDDWKKELTKLHYLYGKAFIRYGWDNYTSIDLRFHNQAVCTRKETTNFNN